jgi:hypothetical protein
MYFADLNQRTAAEQQLTAWENDESVVRLASRATMAHTSLHRSSD